MRHPTKVYGRPLGEELKMSSGEMVILRHVQEMHEELRDEMRRTREEMRDEMRRTFARILLPNHHPGGGIALEGKKYPR